MSFTSPVMALQGLPATTVNCISEMTGGGGGGGGVAHAAIARTPTTQAIRVKARHGVAARRAPVRGEIPTSNWRKT